jgi:hypothetical protein
VHPTWYAVWLGSATRCVSVRACCLVEQTADGLSQSDTLLGPLVTVTSMHMQHIQQCNSRGCSTWSGWQYSHEGAGLAFRPTVSGQSRWRAHVVCHKKSHCVQARHRTAATHKTVIQIVQRRLWPGHHSTPAAALPTTSKSESARCPMHRWSSHQTGVF